MLTQYFYMNKTKRNPKKLLYKHFPQQFVWSRQFKRWSERQRKDVIGRIVTANPTEGERYYLRLLLNHIATATCFEDLKVVNGKKTTSFRAAALAHGLLKSDNSNDLCLKEASLYQMPSSLRRLFATILVYCEPQNPRDLWEKYENAMSDDYQNLQSLSKKQIQSKVLQNINYILESMGKKLCTYNLTDCDDHNNENDDMCKEIEEELNITVSEEDLLSISKLNKQQRHAFDIIMEKVFSNSNGAFFIDGPGGTGKTYLYIAILAEIRSKGFIALPTATSRVARTAHSRFKIPIKIDDNSTCNVSKQSGLAKLFRAAKLIIWDEATMAKRQAIEVVDEMFQDITDCKLPFGGKVIIFGGDFRQVLPVVPKATKEELIDTSLVKSRIWPILHKIRLTENMRARFDPSFSTYVLRVGDGTEKTLVDDKIKLPSSMIIPYTDDSASLNNLLEYVFPNLENLARHPELLINRAILTPKNKSVDDINDLLIDRFPGQTITYHSFDKTNDPTEQGQYEDFLNSLTPNGLPPHVLNLKKCCPVILLRNIDPSEGLCNGTRLICRRFEKNVIDAEIAVGPHSGKRVFLPRIPLQPAENDKYAIPFKRTQFPVRLCFTMTINKAQGQTLDYVGIHLPQPVFSHGQLYVALSRAKTADSIKILIKPTTDDPNENCTKNVVHQDILTLARND